MAEAEVEYRDHVSQSIYVKFAVVDQPGVFIIIWTTTPWTLPANLAVAYNSKFSYSLVRFGGEAYIVSTMLLPSIAEKCGWSGYEIVRSLDADQLEHVEVEHPFCQRRGRLYAGDAFVEESTGTGFVHIAPGHGLEDYQLGLRQGLPIYSPVDDNGCLVHTADLPVEAQMPAEMVGKSILEKHGESEANRAVLHELRLRNALCHQENYHHSYPHCWRSKTPVIFRAMDQWFIRIDHEGFRDRALRVVAETRWIPEWGRSRMEGAIKARPDWCISRQRAWGVPIPAFYDAAGEPILDAQIVRQTAALIEERGSNIWFQTPVAELWSWVKPAQWSQADPVSKSNDTLDVWIDSGSSTRAVLMRHPELRHALDGVSSWQADMYLEGSDQHRGWFQSSLLLSLAGNDAAPYRTVLTHGFMVDEDRQKISKSKQGQSAYEKPQTSEAYVRNWGADVVRLWVASQDFRGDMPVSEERIGKVAETYRMLRNTLRYQLSNLYDFSPAQHAVPDDQLTGLDRWILGEYARLEKQVLAAYDAYEFHLVYQKVSQFAAVELSAMYHDLVKDRLYTDPAESARRRATQTALHRLVSGLCRMLAPILAFTADEAWEFVPGREIESAHLLDWIPFDFAQGAEESALWKRLFELREAVLPALEKVRQDKIIGKSLEAHVTLSGPKEWIEPALACREELRELLNVSQLNLELAPEARGELRVQVSRADGQKCERCWHWETDVGQHAEHPTLCGRCVKAVS